MAIRLAGNAIDLSVWKAPTVTSVNDDGDIVVQKLPSMRSLLMVHPSGNTVHVALHNGMGNRAANESCAIRIRSEKIAKGFLPVGECPQKVGVDDQFMPKAMRGKPACKVSADGHPISAQHPCVCIVETIEWRRKANAKAMLEIESRYDRDDKERRAREAREANQATQTEALVRAVEILSAKAEPNAKVGK